jgi:hypothetical protein
MKFLEKAILKYIFLVSTIFLITNIQAQTSGYHTPSELKTALNQLADEYSKVIKLNKHGETLGSNGIYSVTLASGKDDTKPAILMVAGINGSDLAGTEVLLNFIQSIAKNYGKIDSITTLLDNTTIYVFPQVNPDASEALFSTPQYTRSLNRRPMDLDNDGKVDEDGYDDLNKDGHITWLRIAEPGGEWLEDKDYPGLLVKATASKGETGIYRLIREGIDNDGDGEIDEDEQGGVNFNQNFTFKYKYFTKGAGYHQVSEIETRAITDFIYAHPNIAIVFSFSPNDNLNKPWEAPKGPPKEPERGSRQPIEQIDMNDAPYFAHIAESFKNITKLSDLSNSEPGQGAFSEWVYYHFGRWSFSTPTWWAPLVSGNKPDTVATNSDSTKIEGKQKTPQKPGDDSKKTNDQTLWDWIQATNQKDAFVEWQEIKHPDFPDKKVELGGFKPFPANNPPSDSLEVLSKKYYPFLLKLSSWLPKLMVKGVKVEDLHNNVYRLTLTVINQGYLPSIAQIGAPNKWCPKIKLHLDLDKGQKIVSGKILQFIERLEGSGGNQEISWMVMGNKGETVKITIGSPMTGTVVQNVKLQ